MSIQALQLALSDRGFPAGHSAPAGAVSGASPAAVAATQASRSQDQVEVSDQARQLAATVTSAEVELQLSPARLREMMAAEEAAQARRD
jgi:hypothetical protein